MEEKENINVDFSELLAGLDNKWVIISEDNTKVIASSEELEEISDKLSEGVLIKVPDSASYLAPFSLPL